MAPTPPERTRVVVVFDTDTDTDDAIAATIAQLDETDLVTLVNVRPSPLVAAGATPMLSAAAMTMSEIGWRMYHDACAGGTEEEERIRARTAHHSTALRAAGIGHVVETVVARGRAGSPRSRRTVDRAVTRIARRFRADRIVRTTKPGVPSRPGADDRTAPTAVRLHRSGGSSAPLAS